MAAEILVQRLTASGGGTRPDDIEALAAMMERTGRLHATFEPGFALAPGWEAMQRGWLRRVLADPDWYVALATVAGQVAGCLMATLEDAPPIYVLARRGFLSDVWVEEAWRRMGVTRALVAAAETWFRERGVSRIELSVAMANAPGRATWQRLGYHPTTERWARDLGAASPDAPRQ
jgi:GNAT superfamily N-acetyltransferase